MEIFSLFSRAETSQLGLPIKYLKNGPRVYMKKALARDEIKPGLSYLG